MARRKKSFKLANLATQLADNKKNEPENGRCADTKQQSHRSLRDVAARREENHYSQDQKENNIPAAPRRSLSVKIYERRVSFFSHRTPILTSGITFPTPCRPLHKYTYQSTSQRGRLGCSELLSPWHAFPSQTIAPSLAHYAKSGATFRSSDFFAGMRNPISGLFILSAQRFWLE